MKLLDYSVPMNTIILIYNFEGGRNKNGRGQGKHLCHAGIHKTLYICRHLDFAGFYFSKCPANSKCPAKFVTRYQ